MIFTKKVEGRYNIGQNFFDKKQAKDLRRKSVAFFLRHLMPKKIRVASAALLLFQHELPSK